MYDGQWVSGCQIILIRLRIAAQVLFSPYLYGDWSVYIRKKPLSKYGHWCGIQFRV
jgi:hypothetical protein